MPPTRLHADEVDIDVAVARGLLVEQLPAYASLPLHRVPSGGTENAVFRLGDELAMRMPTNPGAVGGLLKEIQWLRVIAPHVSLAVPEVVAVGDPNDGYPFPWAIVRWLAGADVLVGRVDSLTDLAVALGGFVAELESIGTAEVPPPRSAGFVRGLPLIGRDAGFREALEQCDGMLDADRVRAVWDDALAAPDWDGPPVWLHADLIPSNLLVRDGRLAGVLDFGAMATGDPAYDVTPAWQVLDRESRTIFRAIIGADDATWRRARGLVVCSGVTSLPYYLHTNPSMVAIARRGMAEVLSD